MFGGGRLSAVSQTACASTASEHWMRCRTDVPLHHSIIRVGRRNNRRSHAQVPLAVTCQCPLFSPPPPVSKLRGCPPAQQPHAVRAVCVVLALLQSPESRRPPERHASTNEDSALYVAAASDLANGYLTWDIVPPPRRRGRVARRPSDWDGPDSTGEERAESARRRPTEGGGRGEASFTPVRDG